MGASHQGKTDVDGSAPLMGLLAINRHIAHNPTIEPSLGGLSPTRKLSSDHATKSW